MDKIVIEGGKPLNGSIEISGSKNATLPILAATLMTEDASVIHGVPDLQDVATMIKILRSLGASATFAEGSVHVKPGRHIEAHAPWKLVSTMRASICVLGPLLARLGRADVSMPGGCIIGPRPIDLHLKGLAALNADISIEHGYVKARAKKLRGAEVYLGGAYGSSVLATANVMMAAVLAEGETTIINAACEPEVEDLARFLNAMGASVQGAGTHMIRILGVRKLRGAEHRVISDRIEAGTFMAAAAITGGHLLIKGSDPSHNTALIDKLRQSGVSIATHNGFVDVRGKAVQPVKITTLPYPGFPTDLQAQITALMSVTKGISVVTEKIYPERFIHISELGRMGAQIFLEGGSAIVHGVKKLSGAPVMASDLRASAALVLAGLAAEGRTEVYRVYHLDRGYEKVEKKLEKIGARIWREKA
ncbi:MAG: UDP-N-acetylglucosamine 1-carboxyvinyltransferase [Candidatus Omnitrophica bacterium]|nr:UDP-N-acetylglucosamine 1-carboxyvinyltransferase [Candidatus Omnitrophota bacterium]